MNNNIEGLMSKYKVAYDRDIIKFIFKKYPFNRSISENETVPAEKPVEKIQVNVSKPHGDTKKERVIKVGKTYVKTIMNKLIKLKDILLDRDYNAISNIYEKILKEDDYEESDDVMSSIHNGIEKYVYGSFVKVAPENFNLLTEYIADCGYKKIEIPAQSSVKNYFRYFKDTFPIKTDDKMIDSVIKKINRDAYEIAYDYDGDTERLILKGSCDYYKYMD